MGSCLSTQRGNKLKDGTFLLKIPTEIWLKILKYLSVSDLCRLALVCRFLYNIASGHTLWTGEYIKNVRKVEVSGFESLFSIQRFSQIKTLDISDLELMPKHWSINLAFLKSTKVEELSLRSVDLSQVSKYVMADCISNLRKVNLRNSILAVNQLDIFLTAISESTVLEELDLYYLAITSKLNEEVDHEKLANLATKAACNLRKVVMGQLEMFYTKETIIKFCRSCLLSTSLEELHCSMDVSEVPIDLFAKVMCHLQKPHFSYKWITSDQLNALFHQNLDASVLKHLSLHTALPSAPELSSILLTHSISKLERIDLSFCHVTSEQSTAVFSASVNSPILNSINFANVDLSEVHNIPEAVGHLRSVGLQGTNLSFSQITTILNASLDSTTLEEVNLWYIDLSEIPATLLSQAMCRLRKVIIGSSKDELTLDQCNQFLTATLSSITLENLTLYSAHLPHVPASLTGKAISRLQRSNLEFNDMTKDQLSSMLVYSSNSQTIKEVRLSHSNLHALYLLSSRPFLFIPTELILNAKNKFRVSDLTNQRVIRGRDWGKCNECLQHCELGATVMNVYDIAIGDEDAGGGGYVAATRLEFASGLVQIRWNNGSSSFCRMGWGECFDIKLDPEYGNEEWLGDKIL